MSKRLFPEGVLIEQLNAIGEGCMIGHLGIELIEIGADFLIAKMPVDHRTKQPMGLLHGGANVALAESMGSYASTMIIDMTKYGVVGLEISANHIRSAREGFVYGKVTPIHVGRKTHVWNIEITN
ncbi:MAG: hotdog fold thioesterase, partial [Cyclobacteriaceae bacterium]